MDDLISRQAAIDEAEGRIDAVYCEENDKRERKAIKSVIGSLKKMPPAQPGCEDCIKHGGNVCPPCPKVPECCLIGPEGEEHG